MAIRYGANQSLYSFFEVFEFAFYFFVLHYIIRSKRGGKIILFTAWLYPVIALANIFFVQGVHLNVFATYSYSLGVILIIAFCVYYFYELFRAPGYSGLLQLPSFWICSGLLIFYGCTLPLFVAANVLRDYSNAELRNLGLVLSWANYVLYLSFAIACLCGIKFPKRIKA